MEDIISQTKAELLRAKDRMAHVLATTPDDKLAWSPSPTARTPLQLVGHAASGIPGIQGMLTGQPFPFAGLAEFDAFMRADEQKYTGREQVLALLEQTHTDYLTWLDTLTPEQLGAMVQPPFGPPVPMAVAITFPAYHLNSHIAQMDYIQTIYGDQDWHMPAPNQA
jgi:hypothetical protein